MQLGLVAMMLASAAQAAAGRNVWTPIGPDGGVTGALAVDPANSRIAFAATYRGVFKTIDGEHWRAVLANYIAALAVDPRTPSLLYAGGQDDGGRGYIRRSEDAGETWSAPIPVLGDLIVDIAIDPQQPSTLYVTDGSGSVAVSRDRGATWTRSYFEQRLSNSLAVDPSRSGTIHVAASSGVYTSSDYGTTWAFRPVPEPNSVATLTVDPRDSDVLYAGTYETGLLRSIDAGITWTTIGDPIVRGPVWTLTADAEGGAVYIGTERGVFRARGAAAAIEPTGLDSHSISAFAASGTTLYAGMSGAGILRSDDGGATWRLASSGLGGAAVAIVAGIDSTLYAPSDGVFRSTDRGRRWTLSAAGLRDSIVRALVAHPSRADTVYVGTGQGVFVSDDRAETWQATAYRPG